MQVGEGHVIFDGFGLRTRTKWSAASARKDPDGWRIDGDVVPTS